MLRQNDQPLFILLMAAARTVTLKTDPCRTLHFVVGKVQKNHHKDKRNANSGENNKETLVAEL
jgi:hypothetical protein